MKDVNAVNTASAQEDVASHFDAFGFPSNSAIMLAETATNSTSVRVSLGSQDQ